MDQKDLKTILGECKKAAQAGYKIASAQEKNLSRVLKTAEEKVNDTIIEFKGSSCYSPETMQLLESQLSEVSSTFNQLSFAFNDDLRNLKENLSNFSITLFGRTMAGKSTLMEVLTDGDGSSIGNGAQRTTRDVREYFWNDLKITDVPGICAFEGEDDEQIAFEAAKKADLILFLITDDAPQAAEAECLSRIVDLGKPIICVMNVKFSIAEDKSMKLMQRDEKNRFAPERLENIRKQFLLFAEQFGQSWTHIPFVYVHLMSAYVALKTEDEEKSKFFYELSHIGYLEERIENQVKSKGEFYRIKTFIDIISNPVLESMESLLEQSQMNSIQGRTIVDKRRKLVAWKEIFYRDGQARIKSEIIKIKGDLNEEISTFAEDHFDDRNADKAWQSILTSKGIGTRCQNLLENLKRKCDDQLKEVSREIGNELKFETKFATDRSLRMGKIVDGRKIWNWSSIVLSGVLSIATCVTGLLGSVAAGPLGWAALAVGGIGGLVSQFIKNRDEREYEARARLEKKLKESVDRICRSLNGQMNKEFDKLVSNVEGLTVEMDKINSVIFALADTQRELAWRLDDRMLELNEQILTEAIRLIGADGLQYHMQSVARVPGNTSIILLNDGTVFPNEQTKDLYKLMSERINFVYDSDSKRVLISRVLGKDIDRNSISIEEKIGVAHIPLGEVTPNMRNRIRLAQQFSRLMITNA